MCARVAIALVLLAIAGCATIGSINPPQPWEKGELAKREMQFDPDPLDARATQHVYTSKEGAGGGFAVGGGGCGCN